MACMLWDCVVEEQRDDDGLWIHGFVFCLFQNHLFVFCGHVFWSKKPQNWGNWLQEFVACQKLGVKVEMQDLGNDPASGKIGTAIQFANAAEFHPLLWAILICSEQCTLLITTVPSNSIGLLDSLWRLFSWSVISFLKMIDIMTPVHWLIEI